MAEDSGAVSSTGTDVDTTNIDALSVRANALYAQIQELAIGFEEKTAGAKVAKDKAKGITA